MNTTPRYSFFWPILIYLIGAGSLSFYHVMSLETQYEEVASAVDKLDPQVKHAEYERDKFFAFARDLVRMAPRNANAAAIVKEAGLLSLQEKYPVLMSLDQPSGFTNTAPTNPAMPPPAQVYGATNTSLPAPAAPEGAK